MKLNIRIKILLSFGIVLVLIGAVNIYALTQIQTVADGTTLLYEHPLAVTRASLAANVDVIKIHRAMKDVALAKDTAGVNKAYETVDALEKDALQQLGIVETQILGDTNKAAAQKAIKDLNDWKPIREQVVALMRKDTSEDAAAAAEVTRTQGAQQVTAIEKDMAELIDIADKRASATYADAETTRSTVTTATIIALVCALLISIVLGLYLTNNIVRPLMKVVAVSKQIGEVDLKNLTAGLELLSQGNLNAQYSTQSQKLDIKQSDEVGELANAFNEMIVRLQDAGSSFMVTIGNLRNIIGQVAESADNLGNASSQMASAADQAGQATNQISTTIQQIAKGITQQTESIGKTASSVEQMGRAIDGVAKGAQEQSNAVAKASTITSQITKAIQEVAVNALTGAKGAAQAADTVRSGAHTVQETIAGMQSIKAKVGLSATKVQEMGQRSDQIGAIVETIDDIASQTNLLALNAAIEAARAGEHGKGFAVVADEVRKLAERSSSATKEIGSLIKGIQKTVTEAVSAMDEGAKEVENGVTSASQSDQALANILKAAETANQQMEEIAQAAQHINMSSNELISSMDSVSAVVEENTAATEEMSANSTEVTQAVETIASVSEENSAAVEEVSAGTEEMTAQVEEVNASAQSLMEMAKVLQQVVAQFKI